MRVTLPDFLTDTEIMRATRLRRLHKEVSAAQHIASEIIKPNILRINQRLGQDNDPLYLAYLVVYVLDKAERSDSETRSTHTHFPN